MLTCATDFMQRFVRNQSGATAIEYGLVMTFVSLAILAIVQQLGSNVLNNLYVNIAAAFTG